MNKGYIVFVLGMVLAIGLVVYVLSPFLQVDAPPTRYFECSFSKTYPSLGFDYNQNFPKIEPCEYPCEKGVWHWVVVRRTREPYGGNMRLIPDPETSDRACLECILDCVGDRPLSGDQMTKLYEIQNRATKNYVGIESEKEVYYSLKCRLPSDFLVKNWRLIWQVCGEEGIYGNSTCSPLPQISLMFTGYDNHLVLNVAAFYYPQDGQYATSGQRFAIMDTTDFPKDRWVHITVYVKQGSCFRKADGTVIVWIDEVNMFENHGLPTSTYSGTPYMIWGIGNYGGGEELYGQSILFKDVIVSDALIE